MTADTEELLEILRADECLRGASTVKLVRQTGFDRRSVHGVLETGQGRLIPAVVPHPSSMAAVGTVTDLVAVHHKMAHEATQKNVMGQKKVRLGAAFSRNGYARPAP